MKRIGAVLAALVLSLGFLVAAPSRAYAAGAPITSMDIAVTVNPAGSLSVTESFDMDFTTPGHGPYLYFTTRQKAEGANRYRVYDYQVLDVDSPTGAPTGYVVEDPEYGTVALRIGDADRTVSGTQRYVVSYTVSGVLNPDVSSSGLDELFWNVIGTGFVVPIQNVTVTLSSPATVSQVTCWTGATYDRACTSSTASGSSATFTQASLATGQGLAIVAGWPAGTFPGAEPTYETHVEPVTGAQLNASPWSWAAGGVAVLVAALLAVALPLLRGRDEVYVGLPPGSVPAQGETAKVAHTVHVPYAVQFTPPKDVSAAMIGTLFDETADTADVTAAMVDLAVRGYWRIEGRKKSSFAIVRLRSSDGLEGFELEMYKAIFTSDRTTSITSGTLRRKPEFGVAVQKVKRQLYEDVVAAGWFASNPQTARIARRAIGIVVAVLTLLAGLVTGLLALAVCGPLVGGAVTVSSWWAPRRSALGSAMTSQALGFKQYLETAEADQIRWEEGEDIFSRYLPYAIAFGCADRWAKVVGELAASGASIPVPTWYSGPGWSSLTAATWASGGVGSIVNTLDGFSASAASAMTVSSAGSSGGSGFSGGGFSGGFGGGGGGGGGGSW